MFEGIALSWNALSLDLLDLPDLQRRVHDRGGEWEVQFLFRDRLPILPVWHEGQMKLIAWGSKPGRQLPTTGWTWLSTVEEGGWQGHNPEQVDIPAALGQQNGVWFQIRQGIRGLLVHDEAGEPHVYMLCEPATYYFKVMTRSNWMPVLIGERY